MELPGVRKTIHRLPLFALPYKRFVTEVVRDRSQDFLGSDQSYRDTVWVQLQGRPILYDDRQDEALGRQGAALAHSTVWRWLSWLGDGLQKTVREAQKLIHQRNPRSTLHRETWSVSPNKHRSESRRKTLQRALQALVVAEAFQRLFGKAIFPNFAMGQGWC